jgi:putative transposase
MSEDEKYHRESHSKFLLQVHLVFACKYRKKLLWGPRGETMKQIFRDIEALSDFTIKVMEVDLDHIHLLVDYPPTLTVVSIVRRLKSMPTVRIWDKMENYLLGHFWKERTFWSDGYFACSVGDASAATIRRYIEEQG